MMMRKRNRTLCLLQRSSLVAVEFSSKTSTLRRKFESWKRKGLDQMEASSWTLKKMSVAVPAAAARAEEEL